jgi:diaminopimelate epimerase
MNNYPFSKYSGCGNDFILIDNRKKSFPLENPFLIPNLCNRKMGIGADGIVLLENSSSADFRMRIFNSDGSEAEMCGNGVRCLGKFLKELGEKTNNFTIETMHRKHSLALLENGSVRVEMGDPSDIQWEIPLSIEGGFLIIDSLNTGVPHAICFMEDIEKVNLCFLGPQVRHHPYFPRGTNFNIAEVDKNGEVWVRTFERGVEEETLACGTGATAAAIAASKKFGLLSPILVHTKSKEILEIQTTFHGYQPTKVFMTGAASFSYSGVFSINNYLSSLKI